MKKIILTLAVVTTLLAGTIFTGCKSKDQKEWIVPDTVLEAKHDLAADNKN